jgi:diguanylate cyclase (GGDEF)-like protein/PAS domain S-box-containing protein
MRSSGQIYIEIVETLGFVPPFFDPAQSAPQVLEALWQYTLAAYVNNPLPARLKEKLSAYLSRYCAVPYCMICHSCSLRPLGVKGWEVLALLASRPPTQTEVDRHFWILTQLGNNASRTTLTPLSELLLRDSPVLDTALEESLLACAIFIFLAGNKAEDYRAELRSLLPSSSYQYLVAFVAYIRTCHGWVEAHPEIQHEADQRVQDYLGELLAEEPGLTDFFDNYREIVCREGQTAVAALEKSTEHQPIQVEQLESEERYRIISALTSDFAYAAEFTPEGQWCVEWVTDAFFRVTGYTLADIEGPRGWSKMIYAEDLPVIQQFYGGLLSESVRECEHRILTKGGEIRWVHVYAQPRWDETHRRVVRMFGAAKDITKQKRAEAQLLHHAFHDTLTGLPNRALFLDRLEHALQHNRRNPDYQVAVLFLDLDRFKVINDSLGHPLGDQLLVGLAQRLKTCLRSCDTIARLGGDEFTILLEGLENSANAVQVSERIQEALTLPFTLAGQEVFITISIGIAFSMRNDNQAEALLRNADIAMYQAKKLGKARHAIFNPKMHTQAVERLQLENDLWRALERQEFLVYYQPIVSLETGCIQSLEALVRWQHPQRGLLSPNQFLSSAEEIGLGVLIDQWILREACRQAQQWQVYSQSNRPLSISVNVGNKTFAQSNLQEQIHQILHDTSFAASDLKLEICETVIMSNSESTATKLLELKALGIRFVIDDFGTGYSSLAHLHRFPIDELKIDRSFVTRIGHDKKNFINAIVALAQYLEIEVTAEGIETLEQLQQLKALNCRYGQGYFFSPPLPGAEAQVLLNTQFQDFEI